MQARIKWVDHMTFLGESGSGHSVIMDGAPEFGGRDLGIRPMEMLLLGMGGCASFDIVAMLKKARQDITDLEVELSSERAEEIPKVFTKIHAHFIIRGRNIKETQVKRAIELSAEKYCSASIMLGATAEITHDYEIEEI